MEIETVDDLVNQIADWLGVYGGCKAAERGEDNCEESEKNVFCCRVGFAMMMKERIENAVHNDNLLYRLPNESGLIRCKYCGERSVPPEGDMICGNCGKKH